jgi:hypothetical protein
MGYAMAADFKKIADFFLQKLVIHPKFNSVSYNSDQSLGHLEQ